MLFRTGTLYEYVDQYAKFAYCWEHAISRREGWTEYPAQLIETLRVVAGVAELHLRHPSWQATLLCVHQRAKKAAKLIRLLIALPNTSCIIIAFPTSESLRSPAAQTGHFVCYWSGQIGRYRRWTEHQLVHILR